MRRLLRLVSGILLAAAATAAALVAVEIASYAALRWLARRDRARPLPEASRAYYNDKPWAAGFWSEQRAVLSFEAHPFGLWRSKPFAGSWINVDAAGVRHSHGSRCETGRRRIYVFGGSTVWGYGAPDAETIPSHLARVLAERGQAACVVNFGEDSWRSSHGVVKLALELRAGRRPDLAVFLSGCNDVFTPFFLTGRADAEWEFVQSKRWLDARARATAGSLAYLETSNGVQLFRRLVTRLKGPSGWPAPHDPQRLARDVAETYARDVAAVRAMGLGAGFTASFFWQPLGVGTGKRLTSDEDRAIRRQMGPSWRLAETAVAEVTPLVGKLADQGLTVDLSSLFDPAREELFLDACHFLPEGNRRVAEAVANKLSLTGAEEVQRVELTTGSDTRK